LSRESPVGVFDSGVGGLSILRAVRAALPAEHLVYVADAGHLPYGEKSESEIRARSRAVTAFLLAQGAKAILVACNTATAAAIEDLRQHFAVPFVGVEPAVKPAARLTRSGVIGLLVTGSTQSSARLDRLLRRHGSQVQILVQACPGLVEQVEREAFEDEATLALLRRYLRPLLDRGADTLILGCTHYVFLESAIRQIAGPQVTLLETGAPVAQELARRLDAEGWLRNGSPGNDLFWTTGSADHLTRLLRRVWPRPAGARSWHPPVSAC
jgi:glutamate racemase